MKDGIYQISYCMFTFQWTLFYSIKGETTEIYTDAPTGQRLVNQHKFKPTIAKDTPFIVYYD